jgi:hypothetical protein
MRRVTGPMKPLVAPTMAVLLLAGCLGAQEKPPSQEKQPQVRVNVLNVCAPSPNDQKEIAAALARISRKPRWATDFEVARGRTTVPEQDEAGNASPGKGVIAAWARIRREFSPDSPFLNVQYSFSRDNETMVETLVFRLRDTKELLEASIEDRVSAVTSPAAMLATNTPANRIKLERFGKSSIVLARCTDPGSNGQSVKQSAYEPLFRTASEILGSYRDALGARRTIPDELNRLSETANAGSAARAARKNVGSKH